MILAADADQPPGLLERRAVPVLKKSGVNRRQVAIFGHGGQPGDQGPAHGIVVIGAGGDQQARPGRRGEGHRHLQLGIVPPTGALDRLRPAMVEDILAIGVGLHIGRHDADDPPLVVLHDQMLRHPPGLALGRPADLQRRQEGMADERVVRPRADVPIRRFDGGDVGFDAQRDGRGLGHGNRCLLHRSVDREQRLDLDRRVERQRGDADRGAGVLSGFAQNSGDQVGCAVHHLVLLDKVGSRGDEPAQPDAARDAAEIAQRRLRLGQDVDGAKARRALAVFQRYASAELALDRDGTPFSIGNCPEMVSSPPSMTKGT